MGLRVYVEGGREGERTCLYRALAGLDGGLQRRGLCSCRELGLGLIHDAEAHLPV